MKIKLTLAISCIMLLTSVPILALDTSYFGTPGESNEQDTYTAPPSPIFDPENSASYEYKEKYHKNDKFYAPYHLYFNFSCSSYLQPNHPQLISNDEIVIDHTLFITNDIESPGPIDVVVTDHEQNIILTEENIQPGETRETDTILGSEFPFDEDSHYVYATSPTAGWYITDVSTKDPQIYE